MHRTTVYMGTVRLSPDSRNHAWLGIPLGQLIKCQRATYFLFEPLTISTLLPLPDSFYLFSFVWNTPLKHTWLIYIVTTIKTGIESSSSNSPLQEVSIEIFLCPCKICWVFSFLHSEHAAFISTTACAREYYKKI